MSKYETFGGYPQRSFLSAEAALLTVWPSLSRYHDDLVLVGGLAINYLTERDVPGLPEAITLDVDFGVSLAASGGQYGTIKSDLAGLGFVSEDRRMVRRREDVGLYIDFLTEDPNRNALGSRVVDEVIASVVRESIEHWLAAVQSRFRARIFTARGKSPASGLLMSALCSF